MRSRAPGRAFRRAVATVIATIVVSAVAGPAGACPVCDSGTGDDVRNGIREDLAVNVAATVLPFAAVGGVVLAVRFGPLSRVSRPTRQEAHR